MRTRVATVAVLLTGLSSGSVVGFGAPQSPAATFKAGVDLVRVAATVRDRKGRLVRGLEIHDFEVFEGGRKRTISDFRMDDARVSVALLFDVSGSMESRMGQARETASHLLSFLFAEDEVAIYTFDTQLDEVMPFRTNVRTLPSRLTSVTPFGATSLHDAIGQTAERMTEREGRRRAIVVLTDGEDNASVRTPGEVSGIASAIDVPVYITGLVPLIDNPDSDASPRSGHSPFEGGLGDLARWTGGHAFAVSTASDRSLIARRIVDELRHQYLLAFESSGIPGWHPLVVKARAKDLTVRARSGYFAGQSRPNS